MLSKTRKFVVTIVVTSRGGERPVVRTLGGDTVFVSLIEGQTADWKIVKMKTSTKSMEK